MHNFLRMKVTYFNDLSLQRKALILKGFGTYLQSVESEKYKILLFALNQHFIEAYYSLDSTRIECITVADYDDLDKYLPRISLWKL